MTFVIKCKTDDKEKFLTKEGNLSQLDGAERYTSKDVAFDIIGNNGLLGLAKVRRFIKRKDK